MKKIILIASLFTASIMSANSGNVEKKNTESTTQQSQKVNNNVATTGCFPFMLSCGIPGTACGDSTPDLVAIIWDLDKIICGEAES